MEVVTTVQQMTTLARAWDFRPDTALVPTMGYLHDGHLKLVREARAHCERVIVSIFVNPLQFGPSEDFGRYPRNFDRDVEMLSSAGVDLVFAPLPADMTPPEMTYQVDPGPAANVLCGRYRPGHFIGVATIVMKLFQVVRAGQAFFGWKDAQQFLILQKMVRDLNVPMMLTGVETVREPDGLAMSSRNSYLTEKERRAAPVIYQALRAAGDAWSKGECHADKLAEMTRDIIASEPAVKLQYVEIVSMDGLEPVDKVQPGNTLIAVAAHLGSTRLIDNIRL